MNENKKQEALENIELIKALIVQTKKNIGHYGGGWICFIWGIFTFVGVAGQRLFIPEGSFIGVWWVALTLVAGFATYSVSRHYNKKQPVQDSQGFLRYYLRFWIPLLILGYTLATFIALHASLSNHYISIAILLVVATGFMIIGLTFNKGILTMGIIGYIGSIIAAIYFLEYSDIILGILFGVGLITTGFFINKQWKNT